MAKLSAAIAFSERDEVGAMVCGDVGAVCLKKWDGMDADEELLEVENECERPGPDDDVRALRLRDNGLSSTRSMLSLS